MKEDKISKIEYCGIEYDIIEDFDASDIEGHHEYQVLKTSRTVVVDHFSFFPTWDEKKQFRWFSKNKARYRLFLSRRQEFDDGMTYQNYWGKWDHEFRLEEFLKQ